MAQWMFHARWGIDVSGSDQVGQGLNGEPFHVGVVVSNLEGGMHRFASLLGIKWSAPVEILSPVDLDGQPAEFTFRFAFARTGPVRLEITEEIPNTIWTAGTGLNHIGYWSDDVAGETKMLEQAGCPTAAVIYSSRDEPSIATMARGPQGMFIELVSTSRRARLERLWAS